MNKLFVSFGIFILSLFIFVSPVMASEIENQSDDDIIFVDKSNYYDYHFIAGTYQSGSDSVSFRYPFTWESNLAVVGGNFNIRLNDGSTVYIKLADYGVLLFDNLPLSDINFIYLSPDSSFRLDVLPSSSPDYSIFFYAIIFILGGAILCRSFK